jgi:hypothetical protein
MFNLSNFLFKKKAPSSPFLLFNKINTKVRESELEKH